MGSKLAAPFAATVTSPPPATATGWPTSAATPFTAVTERVSPASTSLEPASTSPVAAGPSSFASMVRFGTEGASLTPAMVSVTVAMSEPPFPSSTV